MQKKKCFQFLLKGLITMYFFYVTSQNVCEQLSQFRFFLWISSVPSGKYRQSTSNQAFFNILSTSIFTHHSLSPYYDIHCVFFQSLPTNNFFIYQVFTDGITNKLLGCFHEDFPEDIVLIRVYGHKTDLLIDRNAETRNIQVRVFLT